MKINIRFLMSKGLRKILNPPAVRDSNIHETVSIWDHSSVNNSTIGKYSYVSDHTVISYANIGAFCSISSHCMIGGASHPTEFVSTSSVFLNGRNALKKHFSNIDYEPYIETKIGNDVWIGTHCLIKGGINIGDGAVIGMGSVVTKDVGPYEIWAGNPARFIKKRFDEAMIIKLLETKWWELSEVALSQVAMHVNDPKEFVESIALESFDKKTQGV